MDKLKMHSPNLTQDNIARLRELFPGCVTEAMGQDGRLKLAVDFDQLRQELSESIVEGPQERYHLNWPGKREALLAANAPIAKTLRPCREESVDFDTTKNLFIEGDNLDALKLLQETYLGKVKLIYIDPPYNTGNDFIYADEFAEDAENYFKRSNQKDNEGSRLVANTEANGRFHSNWLSMMYPRIRLAKSLLSCDGVIGVSIDESEYGNLVKLLDEIFGSENAVATFVWKTRQASGKQVAASNVSYEHEYLVLYGAESNVRLKGVERDSSGYSNPDRDPRGIWAKHPLDVGSTREERPNCFYDLIDPETGYVYPANPNRVWAFSPPSMKKLIEEKKVLFHPQAKTKPYLKKFFSELRSESKPISTWLSRDDFSIGYNTEGTKIANELFGDKKLFDYPKPVSLLKLIINQLVKDGDLILDFFAGSGTTAHAVFSWCSSAGINASFILVQLPEIISNSTLAFREGYKTISELSVERIRRAGKKVIGNECHKSWNKDIGFRFLKVDSSNMADVYYTPDAIDKQKLKFLTNNIKPGRNPEDLLFQVLLDWGVDLSLPIRQESIQGKIVFFVNDSPYDLIACFESGINEDLVKELARFAPLRVVFRDSGFVSDAVKINVEQIFKLLSPATEVKTI